MYIGVKNVAPSTPEAIAIVAKTTATGNMNQYSKVIVLLAKQRCLLPVRDTSRIGSESRARVDTPEI